MNEKEQLYYLINGLISGSYRITDFCSEFNRIFNLEIDYDILSKQEDESFSELSTMTGRFSDDEEDLKLPHVYFDEKQIKEKVRMIKETLSDIHSKGINQ